ncbi:MAG: hypothetical protein JNJ61_04620 [Anaerolineae bacterium]|nr:hypothetical protein [Anaerolineae bacterium]
MSIELSWDSSDRGIICIQLNDNWAWDEFSNTVRIALEGARTVAGRVDLFVTSMQNELPAQAAQLQRIISALPGNLGIIVLVASDEMGMELASALARLVGKGICDHLFFASSVGEARQVIMQQRLAFPRV